MKIAILILCTCGLISGILGLVTIPALANLFPKLDKNNFAQKLMTDCFCVTYICIILVVICIFIKLLFWNFV